MSHIEDIVDALEKKISKVLQKQRDLEQANRKLQEALHSSNQELQEKEQLLVVWQDKYEALKLANSMLGSDDNKRETKLKINALIREIDHCIAQLSD
ncbi:hypothetical protein [Oceanihabitans sediminis]|uniref:Cell division protein ZapB n=1 Tax=Oceanihabitans sediminis TaxID=1812012 RepID=A0A368P119_9FLAO|nr:hypothetical protein [Oceanihabitans sediminis]MDX1277703.1 hypothetical protein [Oceanihabitans sediminis]MDX1774447.1 hypothetical protein [Oceanihabitans sediminis]RBP27733.1 hypothetical protein DFR65_10830 [Oceanihabitans sediminis]RCU56522.1 hypothetical protein DU428_11525 [Oceanihabitans sediminis]